MRIAIASDHAGFELKEKLNKYLIESGQSVQDLGTYNSNPVDYPDYAEALALVLKEGRADRGVLICGSGVGVTVAANKISGIRACLCHDIYSAHQGVEHDAMNILVLGAWVVGEKLAEDLVDAFLQAQFSGEVRHLRRLKKIEALENLKPTGT